MWQADDNNTKSQRREMYTLTHPAISRWLCRRRAHCTPGCCCFRYGLVHSADGEGEI